MIELRVATLCDAASVREGLLNVLGGGITLLRRESFPSPLGLHLAMLFEIDEHEAGTHHDIRIAMHAEHEPDIPGIALDFDLNIGTDSLYPSSPSSSPLIVGLEGAGVPAPGKYWISISCDGRQLARLNFDAIAWKPDA